MLKKLLLSLSIVPALILPSSTNATSYYGSSSLYRPLSIESFDQFLGDNRYVVAYIAPQPSFTVEDFLSRMAHEQVAPGVAFTIVDTAQPYLYDVPGLLGLSQTPALVLFETGQPVTHLYGYISPEKVLRLIESHFGRYIRDYIQAAPHLFLPFGQQFFPRWWRSRWRPSWWRYPSSKWPGWGRRGLSRRGQPRGNRWRWGRDRKGSGRGGWRWGRRSQGGPGSARPGRGPSKTGKINWGKVKQSDARVRGMGRRTAPKSGSINWGKVRSGDARIRRRMSGAARRGSRRPSGAIHGMSPMQQLQRSSTRSLAPQHQVKPSGAVIQSGALKSGGARMGKFRVGQGRRRMRR